MMKLTKKLAVAAPSSAIPHYSIIAAKPHTRLASFLGDAATLSSILKRWHLRIGQWLINLRTTAAIPAKSAPITGWAPLIKASRTTLGKALGGTNEMAGLNHRATSLAQRSVLCIGGRIRLYPEYGRMIADCGGRFSAFHGDTTDSLENLLPLLEQTDLIICPVDCVNHEAFLMVKRYCQHSRKPCVLIDRSEARTFDLGIRALAAMQRPIPCD